MSSPMQEINHILQQIRPAIQADGGDIEFIGFDQESGIVSVKLHGACVGCPMSQITLKMGVEAALCDAVPEVRQVIALQS